MDIAAVSTAPDVFLANYGNIAASTSTHDAVTSNVAAIFGRKTDALSAIKLDPAVLEAQVTVAAPEPAQDCARPNVETSVPDNGTNTQSKQDFKAMVLKQEEALLSLTPQQLELLMKFTHTLRRQRQVLQKQLECSFCKNNGESVSWYSTHCLKDGRGRVKCPVLRSFRCPLCRATGDRAHTIKYCPDNIFLDADYWSRASSM